MIDRDVDNQVPASEAQGAPPKGENQPTRPEPAVTAGETPHPPRAAGSEAAARPVAGTRLAPSNVDTTPATNANESGDLDLAGLLSNVDTTTENGEATRVAGDPERAQAIRNGAGLTTAGEPPLMSGQLEMPLADAPKPPVRKMSARPTRGVKQAAIPVTPSPDIVASVRKTVFERLRSKTPAQVEARILGDSDNSNRTQATREQYEKRGNQLARRYQRETNAREGSDIDVREFATWVVSLRVSLKPPVWRAYKQAAITFLSKIQNFEAEAAVQIIENDSAWDGEMAVARPKRAKDRKHTRLTSAGKAKTISFERYERIDAYLRVRVWSVYASTLRLWLRAGIATGLRPDEWRATEIQEIATPEHHGRRRIYLFVLNAKSTSGRGNGKLRTIEISDYTEESLAAIRYMSIEGAKWREAGEFDDKQHRCAQVLYRAGDKLWGHSRGDQVALYTCRHQFILNMRELGYSEVKLSALLGHQVTETQLAHYGKRNATGWSPDKIVDKPNALDDEIAQVRKTLDMSENRKRLDELIDRREKRQVRTKVPPENRPPAIEE